MQGEEEIKKGFIRISKLRKKHLKESTWLWVAVYAKSSPESDELMKFDINQKGLFKIRWKSNKPAAYDGLSWGGCSVVKEE